ncbi:MAG TPA: anti-anti-sigma factor [Lentisphaeria bacterium]|nr:MAG: hypothetical protein A2X47_01025 [Lentisphaerae bacterium GWF2_38_69]HBM17484.1 anti-anti-sigma factor [Lentisphaeria bacterium]
MLLNISITSTGNEIRVKVAEQINFSNAAAFDQELLSVYGDTSKNIILDFTELDYISSAGLRSLIMCSKELAVNNKKLRCVLKKSSKIKNIFYLAGLYSVLNIEEI